MFTEHEYTRLRLGDIIEMEPGKQLRVIHVSPSRARVVPLYTQKVVIKGKFAADTKEMNVTPRAFDISANTECKIVRRRQKRKDSHAATEESEPQGV